MTMNVMTYRGGSKYICCNKIHTRARTRARTHARTRTHTHTHTCMYHFVVLDHLLSHWNPQMPKHFSDPKRHNLSCTARKSWPILYYRHVSWISVWHRAISNSVDLLVLKTTDRFHCTVQPKIDVWQQGYSV